MGPRKFILLFRVPTAVAVLLWAVVSGCAGTVATIAQVPPDWLDASPDGRCASGYSEPTLRPFDAFRQAEAAARASLAIFSSTSVTIRNISVTIENSHQHATLHRVNQTLSNIVVVDIWTDRIGLRGTRDSVWARVCHRAFVPARIGVKGIPQWVLNLPQDRTCTVAYRGRTIRSRDQATNLLEYGRYRLAETLATHNRIAMADHGDDLEIGSVEDVPVWAIQQASTATLVESWLDREGRGPLSTPGVLYGLICL